MPARAGAPEYSLLPPTIRTRPFPPLWAFLSLDLSLKKSPGPNKTSAILGIPISDIINCPIFLGGPILSPFLAL